MTVSLLTVGQTHLGKSGDVKLSELNSSDATTRVYASYGYKRVNSNEVARGEAPSPAASGTGTLTDWMSGGGNAYQQWIPSDEVGSFDVSKSCSAGASSCVATFTVARPAGYANFNQPSVQQQLYVLLCTDQNTTSQCNNAGEDDDPFDGSSYTPGDGTTLTAGSLLENKWYIAGVRMQWNDEATPGSWIRTGDNYTPNSAGTPNAYNGTLGLIFQMPAAPICNGNQCGLGNSRENACDNMNSSQAYQTNNSGLAVNDTVYSSGCSSYLSGYIAFGEGDGNSYSLSSGVIQNNAQGCGGGL